MHCHRLLVEGQITVQPDHQSCDKENSSHPQCACSIFTSVPNCKKLFQDENGLASVSQKQKLQKFTS